MNERLNSAWRRHERRRKENRYVYAVVSRRSRGISIGINLNPGKECNFDCVYCQVNRKIQPATRKVDLETLEAELDLILQAEKNGSLYLDSPFDLLARSEHGLRDIAFSGDGEPTAFPHFDDAVRIAVRARNRFGLLSTKLILLTDAAYLHKPAVKAALSLLDENNGEIWAKLDAGTEGYFRAVNRPNVTLERIVRNVLDAACVRPVTIQSLWFRMEGASPPAAEIESYCARLNEMVEAGGKFRLVQLYTTAREPAEPAVSPLADVELDSIAATVRTRVPVPVEVFYNGQ
jgi:wyosine [tRNA(Phe)-imidazoG37] synthetase (radical SAM superfamily)